MNHTCTYVAVGRGRLGAEDLEQRQAHGEVRHLALVGRQGLAAGKRARVATQQHAVPEQAANVARGLAAIERTKENKLIK